MTPILAASRQSGNQRTPAKPGADPEAVSAINSEFTDAYRDYNQEHNRVVAELLAACPED